MKDFETYIRALAQDLHDAAAMKAWDIPIAHRTKDSISAYRAAVGVVGAVMLKTLEKQINPVRQDATPAAPEPVAPEPVVEDNPAAEAPLAAPQSLFSDEPAPETRRRRRNAGENDAA